MKSMNISMRLYPRARLIFISVVSFLLVGSAVFAFRYMAGSVIRNGNAIWEIQSKIDDFARERMDAKIIEEFLDERGEDYARIREFYIDAKQPVAFLEHLEALARTTGNALAINLDGGGNDARHLGFRLTLEGSEEGILTYVRLLERVPYHVEIAGIFYQSLVSDVPPRAGEPLARLSITLRVRTR